MGILDKEVKRNNAILTKNNEKLHNSLLEMRGMYVLLKRRNMRLMRDNTRLYRMIKLMRLQKKNFAENRAFDGLGDHNSCSLATESKAFGN